MHRLLPTVLAALVLAPTAGAGDAALLRAKARFLRGTALDPFGRAEVRRVERRLLAEHLATVEQLSSQLSRETYARAVAVAFNESFMRLWVGPQNYGGLMLTVVFVFIMFYRVMMQVASIGLIGSGIVSSTGRAG